MNTRIITYTYYACMYLCNYQWTPRRPLPLPLLPLPPLHVATEFVRSNWSVCVTQYQNDCSNASSSSSIRMYNNWWAWGISSQLRRQHWLKQMVTSIWQPWCSWKCQIERQLKELEELVEVCPQSDSRQTCKHKEQEDKAGKEAVKWHRKKYNCSRF